MGNRTIRKINHRKLKLAQSMKISKNQYKNIVAKLWICEYNEKENEEIKFRKKARHFLIRNREAFIK